MIAQSAKGKDRTWWRLTKPGKFFAGAKLSRYDANRLRLRMLVPVSGRAETVVRASCRRYPAEIELNHEIVLG